MSRPRLPLVPFVLVLLTLACGEPAIGREQFPPAPGFGSQDPLSAGDVIELASSFQIEQGTRRGWLSVAGDIADGWHCNSLGQTGGAGPLKITLPDGAAARLIGPFTPDREPVEHEYPDIWPGVKALEHEGRVVWTAPVELTGETPADAVVIPVRFNAIVCSNSCIPVRKSLEARFVGWLEPGAGPPAPEASGISLQAAYPLEEFSAGHGRLTGRLVTAAVPAGGRLEAVLTLDVDEGYHTYRYTGKLENGIGNILTHIRLRPDVAWQAATVTPSEAHVTVVADGLTADHYPGDVEFRLAIDLPAGLPPGNHDIEGVILFQTCDDRSCDRAGAARFLLPFTVVGQPGTNPVPAVIRFADASKARFRDEFGEWAGIAGPNEVSAHATGREIPEPAGTAASTGAAGSAFDIGRIRARATGSGADFSLPLILLISLGGGFVLNFMPCVLPVIGLKVMSFLQQAGQNRWQAFVLNVWYTAGILAVFLTLATLAAFFNFGWGKQSQSAGFQIGLSAIVFVMSLSFLGVWEIPIPGFVGSSAATKAADREGILAAVLKGILTTILAVPCSGPGISVALTWCVGKQPWLVYLVFTFLGLGMALPYLVLGLFPSLVRALPRPGQWMETFKEIMGFVLLATVIWLLWTVPTSLMLPSVAFLFALWFACWVYGRTPLTVSGGRRAAGWALSFLIAAGGWLVAFRFLAGAIEEKISREYDRWTAELRSHEGADNRLPWQPFSIARLSEEIARRKTVVVDFTADWCLTCKTLEKTVLNTQPVREWVEKNGIQTLLADWTEPSPDVDAMLQKLGSEQIPVLAVFPADNPYEPIVLMGGYTRGMLMRVLREAGPSHAPVAGNVAPVAAIPATMPR